MEKKEKILFFLVKLLVLILYVRKKLELFFIVFWNMFVLKVNKKKYVGCIFFIMGKVSFGNVIYVYFKMKKELGFYKEFVRIVVVRVMRLILFFFFYFFLSFFINILTINLKKI